MKLVNKLLVCISAVSLTFSIGCTPPVNGGDPTPTPEPTENTTGYNALFMGHSFFNPIAQGMQEHAHRAGFMDHTQQGVFAGGGNGSPQALWENASKKNEIQSILNSGDIGLVGMTYHPDYPGIEGYQNWAEYALQQNANTKFFIALPWATNPGTTSIAVYEPTWESGHVSVIHAYIDTLRTEYPDNDFYCIPYGRGAIELIKLFESGNLTDVQSLISESGSEAIFSDAFGHPDNILVTVGQLIWLNAIYAVDLNTYDYDSGYVTELNVLAQDAMDIHDPLYNAP